MKSISSLALCVTLCPIGTLSLKRESIRRVFQSDDLCSNGEGGSTVARVDESKGGIEARAFLDRKSKLLSAANKKYNLNLKPTSDWCPLMKAIRDAGITTQPALDEEMGNLCVKGGTKTDWMTLDMGATMKMCGTAGEEGLIVRAIRASDEDRPDIESQLRRCRMRPWAQACPKSKQKCQPLLEFADYDTQNVDEPRWKIPVAASVVSHRLSNLFLGTEVGLILQRTEGTTSVGTPSDVLITGCLTDMWTPTRYRQRKDGKITKTFLVKDSPKTIRGKIGRLFARQQEKPNAPGERTKLLCDFSKYLRVNVGFMQEDIKMNGGTSVFSYAREKAKESGSPSTTYFGSLMTSSEKDLLDWKKGDHGGAKDRCENDEDMKKTILDDAVQRLKTSKHKINEELKYTEVATYVNQKNVVAVIMDMPPQEKSGVDPKNLRLRSFEKLEGGQGLYKYYKLPQAVVKAGEEVQATFKKTFGRDLPLLYMDPHTKMIIRYQGGKGTSSGEGGEGGGRKVQGKRPPAAQTTTPVAQTATPVAQTAAPASPVNLKASNTNTKNQKRKGSC